MKICFVGSDNYPVLNPSSSNSYIGGESVQQTLLAKAFAKMNYEVSMVVKDHGQEDGDVIDNIRVWKTYKENDGIPVIRYIYPRLTTLWNALKKADADVYYQSCAGKETGVVAYFCKKYQRKFVFRIAHDTDCIPGNQLIRFWRDKKLYEYGLKRADIIAAQSIKQKEMLKAYYNLDSHVINMVVEVPELIEGAEKNIDILWVNNMRPFKRPELALKLARMLPDYRMVMIGGPCSGQHDYYKKIETEAKKIKNLEFMGFVPYHEVNSYFLRAKAFINTSESEGFPNSFLQAWIRGVPVISFFDPDSLISTHGLGYSPENIEQMAECISELLKDESKRVKIGESAREFTIKHYSPENVVHQYIELLRAYIR